jgi:hypothetical protein
MIAQQQLSKGDEEESRFDAVLEDVDNMEMGFSKDVITDEIYVPCYTLDGKMVI